MSQINGFGLSFTTNGVVRDRQCANSKHVEGVELWGRRNPPVFGARLFTGLVQKRKNIYIFI